MPLLLVSCTKYNGHVAVNKKEIVRDCDEIKPFPGVTGGSSKVISIDY